MYAGIDIGGTTIKAGIVDAQGKIHFQTSQPTQAERGKAAVLGAIESLVHSLLDQFPQILAIGVGVPGIVNPQDGCVYHPPNLPGWDIVPLTSILQRLVSIPIVVDNDANAAAIGESELGAARNISDFLYVTLGTGIGGTIVTNNHCFTGVQGGAGELGHIVIDVNAIAEPGKPDFRTGVLEEYIGRQGLLRMAQTIARQYPDSLLHAHSDLDIPHISEAIVQGDKAAQLCFERAGRYLGLGLASILVLIDTYIVIVGGGISQAHPLLLDTAQQTLRTRAFPTIAPKAEIRKAQFGNNAGIIGAAMMAKLRYEQEQNLS